jgi:hypothetical protein
MDGAMKGTRVQAGTCRGRYAAGWASFESEAAVAMEHRRAPRYPVKARGTYRLAGCLDWRHCRLIDLSDQGAGLELCSLEMDGWPRGRIEVRIAVLGGEMPLRGEIRNARSFEDRLRVGVEFVDMSLDERNMIALLIGLEATL